MDLYLGTIFLWPITYAPEGFLFCNGQQLQVSQYQALYSLLSNRFGGQAPANFSLPDFRGRVPVGAGANPLLGYNVALAQTLGATTTPSSQQTIPVGLNVNTSGLVAGGSITLQPQHLPAHSHSVSQQVVSVKIPASSGTVAATLTNDPTNNKLAQGTATTLGSNQAKIYTTGTTNTNLAAFDLTIPQVTTDVTGAGQAVSVTMAVGGNATASGNVAIPSGSFSTFQPSLGIGFIIAVTGLYPVNPN